MYIHSLFGIVRLLYYKDDIWAKVVWNINGVDYPIEVLIERLSPIVGMCSVDTPIPSERYSCS